MISNLINKNYLNDFSYIYTDFCNFSQFIFKDLNQNTKKILDLYYNTENYQNKFAKYFEDNNKNENFEIILYSFKICLICSLSKNETFYSNLLSENFKSTIENNYLPGNDSYERNMKLEGLQRLENFLKENKSIKNGAYVCSCGYAYFIDPCGLPNEESICPNCKEKIGGTNHNLIEREGHYRVYLNEKQKAEVEKISYIGKVNGILIKNYKKLIEDELKFKKGFIQTESIIYNNNENKVRNLSLISYRLLNFVYFSIIVINKLVGNINEEEEKNYCHKGKTSFELIISDWKKIRELLKLKNINNIQIFMNLLFPKIINLFYSKDKFDTNKKREEFENKINNIIEEIINNYNNLSEQYLKLNKKVFEIKDKYLNILKETTNNFSDEEFPYLKYLTVSTYPNLEELKNILNNIENKEEKYPVLYNYINSLNNNKIDKLQNIIKMNEFEMYLINKYSYKLSRINAKNRTVKDELNLNDINIKMKLKEESENFIEAYNNLLDLSTKYMCRQVMPKKKIDNNDPLAYFLNDDGENDYGMRIASIYQNFISFQNEFLDNIYEAIKFSGKNYYYTKNITKEILAQNATKNEVVSLNIETDTYSSFYEIYSNYSNRDIFELNENEYKINYKNYRNINYDLNSIENVLAEILLTGKKKFVADEQIFITYENEGYHGKKSSIILNIIQKYPQKPLNEEKKFNLISNLKDYENIKDILNSFQLFIYILIKLNLPTYKIKFNDNFFTEQIPKYCELNYEFKNFLINNNIQLENLIDVYELIEEKSFKDIIKNIDELYKIKIKDEMKEEIKKYFNNIKEKKNELNKIIDKTILTNVVRQFISRFLCENRADALMNEKNSLFDYLPYKEELWIKYYKDENTNEKIINEIEEMKNLFNIKIENALEFYNYLFEIRDEKKEDKINVEEKKEEKKIENKSVSKKNKIKKIF